MGNNTSILSSSLSNNNALLSNNNGNQLLASSTANNPMLPNTNSMSSNILGSGNMGLGGMASLQNKLPQLMSQNSSSNQVSQASSRDFFPFYFTPASSRDISFLKISFFYFFQYFSIRIQWSGFSGSAPWDVVLVTYYNIRGPTLTFPQNCSLIFNVTLNIQLIWVVVFTEKLIIMFYQFWLLYKHFLWSKSTYWHNISPF